MDLHLPASTMPSMDAQVWVYSMRIDQIGLGEPSGSRSGWGVCGHTRSVRAPLAN